MGPGEPLRRWLTPEGGKRLRNGSLESVSRDGGGRSAVSWNNLGGDRSVTAIALRWKVVAAETEALALAPIFGQNAILGWEDDSGSAP